MYGRRFTEGVPNKPVGEFEARWTLSDGDIGPKRAIAHFLDNKSCGLVYITA
jgi:hypothetical protein